MPQIALLRRSRALGSPAAGQMAEVVEVTYSTPALPPRQVHLPLALYRSATKEELAANPRYQMLPVDPAAEDQEKLEIDRDINVANGPPPDTFELP